MDLSVIMVSYNVCHFIEHAIDSSLKALKGLAGEIIVIDNNSVDHTCDMIKDRFPQVILIENKENLGFSKANNLGLKHASGRYILFLNPDTIVPEDCFTKCISFFESLENPGAVGVKMRDGSGKILPESKRGFPTAWNSICKATGIYKLFPHSAFFNGYYMGHLDYDHNHPVDILTGAFFFTTSKIIHEVNGFSEDYFMYGEDIDLSHRIHLQGYTLYYLAESEIIHFKGESTRKSSLQYWRNFYSAMLIFTNKFNPSNSTILTLLLNIGIVIKGIISFLKSTIERLWMIILDALLIIFGSYGLKSFWSLYFFNTPFYFQSKAIWANSILYTINWILTFYLIGLYDKHPRLQEIVKAVIIGFIVNLMMYSILPESLRSSRMLLFLIFLWVLIIVIISRWLIQLIRNKTWAFGKHLPVKILLVGNSQDKNNLVDIYTKNNIAFNIIEQIDRVERLMNYDWSQAIRMYQPNEIIFCSSICEPSRLINLMSKISDNVNIRFLSISGKGIIGSSNPNDRDDQISVDLIYNLQKVKYQRQKRFFDIIFSIIILLFFWLIMFLQKNKSRFFSNVFSVLLGFKTWVGISKNKVGLSNPLNKPNILESVSETHYKDSQWLLLELYRNYLWNYSIWLDLDICLREIDRLDT